MGGANRGTRRGIRGTRAIWAGAVLVGTILAAGACTPASGGPPGAVAQDPPFGVNGMVQDGSSVWVADLFGKQLVRFDPDTGVIAERYGTDVGLCGTDDVVVLPGGDLVATCPTEGKVIRITRGGTATVLASVGTGVNPIALEPGGTTVVVGFGNESDNRLLRIPVDGGIIQVVASGLPTLNGFDIGADGYLYAPTGGAAGILGTGGLARIDLTTGSIQQIPLTFPDEPGKAGLDFACGADVGADGTVFVVQCFNAAAYAVDPDTGVATLVGRSPLDLADNIVVLDDGRVIVSGFFGGKVGVFTPGPGGYSTAVRPVGT